MNCTLMLILIHLVCIYLMFFCNIFYYFKDEVDDCSSHYLSTPTDEAHANDYSNFFSSDDSENEEVKSAGYRLLLTTNTNHTDDFFTDNLITDSNISTDDESLTRITSTTANVENLHQTKNEEATNVFTTPDWANLVRFFF